MSKSTQLLGCAVLTLALAIPDLAGAQAVPRGSGSSSGSSNSGGFELWRLRLLGFRREQFAARAHAGAPLLASPWRP